MRSRDKHYVNNEHKLIQISGVRDFNKKIESQTDIVWWEACGLIVDLLICSKQKSILGYRRPRQF